MAQHEENSTQAVQDLVESDMSQTPEIEDTKRARDERSRHAADNDLVLAELPGHWFEIARKLAWVWGIPLTDSFDRTRAALFRLQRLGKVEPILRGPEYRKRNSICHVSPVPQNGGVAR